jgi:hypothetical protein
MDIFRYLIQKKEYVEEFDVENPSEMITWQFWKENMNRGKWEGVRIQLKSLHIPPKNICASCAIQVVRLLFYGDVISGSL